MGQILIAIVMVWIVQRNSETIDIFNFLLALFSYTSFNFLSAWLVSRNCCGVPYRGLGLGVDHPEVDHPAVDVSSSTHRWPSPWNSAFLIPVITARLTCNNECRQWKSNGNFQQIEPTTEKLCGNEGKSVFSQQYAHESYTLWPVTI